MIYVKLLLDTTPLNFFFDETTTSQVTKQFGRCMRYWCSDKNEVVASYCGSLFLGHCDSDQTLEHFYSFQKRLDWSIELPLMFMYG